MKLQFAGTVLLAYFGSSSHAAPAKKYNNQQQQHPPPPPATLEEGPRRGAAPGGGDGAAGGEPAAVGRTPDFILQLRVSANTTATLYGFRQDESAVDDRGVDDNETLAQARSGASSAAAAAGWIAGHSAEYDSKGR